MIRDPAYYLSKARYFNRISKEKTEPLGASQKFNGKSIIDENYRRNEIKLQPFILEEVNIDVPNIKPQYARYYDPITKHYYKTADIVNSGVSHINALQNKIKDGDVWFPENKPSVRTFHDPKTGKYYRINKIYDQNGNYTYTNDELIYMAHKQSGTNFYRPIHTKIS